MNHLNLKLEGLMIMSNKQIQKAGDNSQQVQVKNFTLNNVSKDNKISDIRFSLYDECYKILEQNIMNNNIIFKREYIDSIIRIKPNMKLFASNSVLQAFRTYYDWAIDTYTAYLNFCTENDPTDKVHTELVLLENGEYYEDEIADFNDHDLEHYELLCKQYIIDNNVDFKIVKSKIQNILNAMRSDLGNDSFKDDFFDK